MAIYYWSAASSFLASVLSALVPIILGALIAYVVNILMSFYEKRLTRLKLRQGRPSTRMICLLLAFMTILLVVTGVIMLVVPQLIRCVETLVITAPTAIEQILENPAIAAVIPEDIDQQLNTIDWSVLVDRATAFMETGMTQVMESLASQVASFFSVIVSIVIGIIFSIYMLSGKEKILRHLHRFFSKVIPERVLKVLSHILSCLNENVHNYIVGQCLEALILGSLCCIGMLMLRLPYAVMISSLVAVTAMIPVAGAYIGAAVGAFMILSVSPVKALIFLIFLIVLQQLEGNLIYPRVVGNFISTPGILVLAAVTVGGSLFGIAGMLVFVPIVATIYQLVEEALDHHDEKAKIDSQTNNNASEEDPNQS